ncbi:MAG: NAD(P)H-dependent glycerol-3-phosphate dehydrogenase [Paracoccaceae bacterium]
MSVAVLGAGAFGTALAISLSENGPVTLWARSAEHARDMIETRENKARLPGVALPDAVRVTSDLNDVSTCQTLLLAIPLQCLRGFLIAEKARFAGKTLVACCKGAEAGTGLGPVGVIQEVTEDATAAVLTGPSFATEIARGLPTALTLACTDEGVGTRLQSELTTPVLRLYRSTDVTGAEAGGALKNVIAIACGTAIGAGLGESARAALMTRGYAEMVRYATARGAQAETLAGLSGFGDLTLTCGSDLSRNFRRGFALGRGEAFDPAVTVEGVATAYAVVGEAQRSELDMPIAAAVVALLDGRQTVAQAMADLLSRPLKQE